MMAMTPTSIAPAPGQTVAEPAVSRPSLRTILVQVLAGIFLLSLFIPLIGTFRHWDFYSASNENRRLAELPARPTGFKDAQKYSDRWLSFYRDHFGFRNTLIHAVAVSR